MERNNFSNFGRESPTENFREIDLKLSHWPLDEMSFKDFFYFLALAAILFSKPLH